MNKSNTLDDQYKRLIDLSPMPIGIHDQGRLVYANKEAVKLIGAESLDQLLNKPVLQFIHPDYHSLVKERIIQIYKVGKSNTDLVEEKLIKLDGSVIDVEIISMLIQFNGKPAIQFYIRDITNQKKNETQKAFLEKATTILISSLDYETTIQNIAKLIVPNLADYCRIIILDENSEVKDISVHHTDPKKIKLVKELYENYKQDQSTTHGVDKLIQSGEDELISHVDATILTPYGENSALIELLKKLEVKSYMGVPLFIRGKIVGAITFTSTQDGRYYTHDDLLFVKDLAQRISLILDNSKLFSNIQTALKLRDEFLSIASHELKTPITTLKGFTQILSGTLKNQAKPNYYLKRMDDQINRLTGLVNDLLDVSKIQQGKLALNMQEFELNNLINEAIEDIKHSQIKHEIAFHHNGEIKVMADRFRMNQVIINLLTNAIKYSPQADKVIIRSQKLDNKIIVEIEDFGIGIQEKNITKIFEPFYQANTNIRQSFGGLGLGLHISKVIMERHGGDIEVKNKVHGTVFKIVLPKTL